MNTDEQPAPEAGAEPRGTSCLDQILNQARLSDEQERERCKASLGTFVRWFLKLGQVFCADGEATIRTWITEIDRKLSAQLAEIIHDTAFQQLESTWRGLYHLVRQTDTSETLQIKVLDVTRRELVQDFEGTPEFDRSTLFEKVHAEKYRLPGEHPFGMLIGDYEFSHHPQDLGLLTRISQVAAFAHAPFIAAASPKLFNVNRFTEMTASFDLARLLGGVEYTGWKAFRESEDSRYVALTLPRVLGRQPYGEEFHKVDEFNFEEFVGSKEQDKFLWMNSAWAFAALVTGAFARYGWMAGGGGVKGGRKVEGLPVHKFPCDDGGEATKCPTEMAISDRREFELSNLGFLPLLHRKDGDFTGFLGAQSCQQPRWHADHDLFANNSVALSARIDHLLSASRFAHCIRVMVRDQIGSLLDRGECEEWLNDWIHCYCVGDALRAQGNGKGDSTEERVQVERDLMDRCPLDQAKVEVRAVDGKPGRYEAVIRVQPHFHYAVTPFGEISIVAELPNQGG